MTSDHDTNIMHTSAHRMRACIYFTSKATHQAVYPHEELTRTYIYVYVDIRMFECMNVAYCRFDEVSHRHSVYADIPLLYMYIENYVESLCMHAYLRSDKVSHGHVGFSSSLFFCLLPEHTEGGCMLTATCISVQLHILSNSVALIETKQLYMRKRKHRHMRQERSIETKHSGQLHNLSHSENIGSSRG